VSVSASAAGAGKLRDRRRDQSAKSASLVLLCCIVVLVDLVLVSLALWVSRDRVMAGGGWLLLWIPLVGVVGLVSLTSESGAQLALDMPLLLAFGYLFGPGAAGALAFIAYVDPREFSGQIRLVRGLFNRAQTSLAVLAGTAVFALTGASIGSWPRALLAALLAVGVDCFVNYGMMVGVLHLHLGSRLAEAAASLAVGSLGAFFAYYFAYGLLSLLLAEVCMRVGPWGLLAFVLPVVLARHAFSQTQRLDAADRRIRRQGEALRDVSSRISEERRDERLTVASGLHDEVLPPLYKVHLMGQVLRHDLDRGQLLALEDDLPELLRAAEHARDAMQVAIRDLRSSGLGMGGLAETLRLLCRHLEAETDVKLIVDVADVSGSPLSQLLAYQVAQEALRNALRHAKASLIRVHLSQDGGCLRVVVEDDGAGFLPQTVDEDEHFGLLLMRERTELVGGTLLVESSPGRGTTIVARLPADRIYRNPGD
jgi:signal transduction histidine kinase